MQQTSASYWESWDGYPGAEFEDGTSIKGYKAIRYKVDDNKLVIAFSMNGIGSYARYNLYLENPSNIEYEDKYGRYPVQIKANSYGAYSSRTTLTIDPGTYENVEVHLVCVSGGCSQDIYSSQDFGFAIELDEPEPPTQPKPWYCRWWGWYPQCQ